MSINYTEDDLRDAFYKGRERASLPDEKSTTMFIRPTFNGYLRELEGAENPYENWEIRCKSLIDDKDYDLENWTMLTNLRKLQKGETEKKLNPSAQKQCYVIRNDIGIIKVVTLSLTDLDRELYRKINWVVDECQIIA